MTSPTDLETPAVLIDMRIVDLNIARTQNFLDKAGLASRPHIKTHKLPFLARKQIEAGATGITCQKVSEAEVMADGGIEDMFITYNILGERKLARLHALSQRCKLSVVADNRTVVDGLSRVFSGGIPLNVLVECDTGHGRCGVQSPGDALILAQAIRETPGLRFGGLMTYPAPDNMNEVETWLGQAKNLIGEAGIGCSVVSMGGTPNLDKAAEVSSATEYRAGTYIYNDRSLIERGACGFADCALTVQATVVSRPTEERAIVDAGSKVLTSDLLGMEGYGLIPAAPEASIVALSEEHGTVDLQGSNWNPIVGDRVAIIPNHVCVVSNMLDEVHLQLSDGTIETHPVAARGCVL